MRSPSPILFVVATATLMLGRPMALPAADLDNDARARTLSRDNPVSAITRGTHVIDEEDLNWLEFPGEPSIGLNATVLESAPLDRNQVRRYVFATATPHANSTDDYFGLLGSLTQEGDPSLDRINDPEEWSLMGFYSFKLSPSIRLQPSFGWSGAVDDASDSEIRGLLGLEITF